MSIVLAKHSWRGAGIDGGTMPDPYANIADIPEETAAMLAGVLETRAQELEMVAMRQRYFSWLELPAESRAVELGSGPGDVTRDLLSLPNVSEVVGLDPSPVMVKGARARHSGVTGLSFEVGDARETRFDDDSFDVAVFHTTLCHVPGPDRALAEAFRILKPGGRLAVFDGDYVTGTVAIGENDLLQHCVDAFFGNYVENLWLCRSLAARISALGFKVTRRDAHPYLAGPEALYFLSVVDRGADVLVNAGTLGPDGAAAIKTEARRRVAEGTFFGFISFVSVIAEKPEN